MDSKAFLIAVIMVVSISGSALATDYIVGDSAGWKLGVNYTEWAQGKTFFVGDRLVFMYKSGIHDVYKVNGTDFQKCAVPQTSQNLTTGNDVIALATPGRKWYICGVGYHCEYGMKLVITVYPTVTIAPSASAWAPAPGPDPTTPVTHVKSFWRRFKLNIHI